MMISFLLFTALTASAYDGTCHDHLGHDPTPALRADFADAWRTLGGADADKVFDDLARRYGRSERAYHTLVHVADALATFDAFAATNAKARAQRASVVVAFLFHDAVYELPPHRQIDNEAESARLFRRRAVGLATKDRWVIDNLIMATRSHVGVTPLEQAFVDADLAVLGAEPAAFARYERQIRREFRVVPDEAYREGRARVLSKLAARRPLFQTAWFRDTFERRAKSNLARALGGS